MLAVQCSTQQTSNLKSNFSWASSFAFVVVPIILCIVLYVFMRFEFAGATMRVNLIYIPIRMQRQRSVFFLDYHLCYIAIMPSHEHEHTHTAHMYHIPRALTVRNKPIFYWYFFQCCFFFFLSNRLLHRCFIRFVWLTCLVCVAVVSKGLNWMTDYTTAHRV